MDLGSVLQITGITAVSIVALAWLVASFAGSPGVRSRVAWIGACGLYLALGSLFLNLTRNAWEADNTLAWLAFGFLLAIFGSGFCLSLVKTVGAFARARGAGEHATH